MAVTNFSADNRIWLSLINSLFFQLLLQIESNDDILWTADVREANEEVAKRGMKFVNW